MSATQLSILGQFETERYDQVVARLAASAHQAEAFDCEETIFERGPTGQPVTDENVLRLRSTRLASNHQKLVWTMHVLMKPESVRISPEMLTRTIITFPLLEGDPFTFLSALGYRRTFTLYRRGVQFQRGVVLSQIYQLFSSAETVIPLDPNSYILSISASVSEPTRIPPSRSSSGQSIAVAVAPGRSLQELKADAIERIREVKGVVKGLVDLSRVE